MEPKVIATLLLLFLPTSCREIRLHQWTTNIVRVIKDGCRGRHQLLRIVETSELAGGDGRRLDDFQAMLLVFVLLGMFRQDELLLLLLLLLLLPGVVLIPPRLMVVLQLVFLARWLHNDTVGQFLHD